MSSDCETNMIRISDDLSNIDDILNSSGIVYNNNLLENIDKPIQKHQFIVNSTTDLHRMPSLDNESYSEENRRNILMNEFQKKETYNT